MKHIVWQPESKILIDAFNNRAISNDCRGGYIYEYQAARSLSRDYRVSMDPEAPRREQETSIQYWRRLNKNPIQGDVFILSPPVINHGTRKRKAVEIGMLHHVYFSEKKKTGKGRLSLSLLKRRLRSLDIVVTVSKYWQDYVEQIGCKNVRVIYNAFNPEEFVFTEDETHNTLLKHNIPTDKPIVHIGYADPNKGVEAVYNVLKNQGLTLIMTGPKTNQINLPVQWRCLHRKEYLLLLTACDVVVNMSTIEEGWSRVAHEALLCKTPVIGSGAGGMMELLEGSGQLVCESIDDLPGMVKEVIANKESYTERGYEFAKGFSHREFEQAWQSLIQEVT